MVLPVLVCVTVGLAWLVVIAVAQVRCVDAAREAVRLEARGESTDVVDAAVAALAPDGASWEVSDRDGMVVMSVSAGVSPRIPLVGALPAVEVSSDAVAAKEAR